MTILCGVKVNVFNLLLTDLEYELSHKTNSFPLNLIFCFSPVFLFCLGSAFDVKQYPEMTVKKNNNLTLHVIFFCSLFQFCFYFSSSFPPFLSHMFFLVFWSYCIDYTQILCDRNHPLFLPFLHFVLAYHATAVPL